MKIMSDAKFRDVLESSMNTGAKAALEGYIPKFDAGSMYEGKEIIKSMKATIENYKKDINSEYL